MSVFVRVAQLHIHRLYFFNAYSNNGHAQLNFNYILLYFCQLSFSQSEKLEIEGAVIISNSDPSNPVPGTIRWTGLDFEGFNGTVWESLTDCPIDSIDHGQGKTFAQIAVGAHQDFCASQGDESYMAEYLYQHPTVSLAEVQSINNVKCVVPLPDPALPANATVLNPPSGGDDTAMLNAALNQGGAFDGLNRTYRISRLNHTVAGLQLFNITLNPIAGATELIHVNASNVLHYNVNIDAQDQASVYQAVRVFDVPNYRFMKGSIRNIWHKFGGTAGFNRHGGAFRFRNSDNFLVTASTFENIRNDTEYPIHPTGTENIAICNIFWLIGDQTGPVPHGRMFNNNVKNVQSNGRGEASNFMTVQLYNGIASADNLKIYGNRAEDCGKRFLKFQESGGTALSNSYWWRTYQGDLQEPERKWQAFVAMQYGSSNIIVENNRVRLSHGKWDRILVIATTDGPVNDNISIRCNDFLFEKPHANDSSGGGDVIFIDDSTSSANSGREPTNLRIDNNTFREATGLANPSTRSLFFGFRGVLNNVESWITSYTGNTESITYTSARINPI